ncbi:MAG: hypothetical protein PHW41_01930 [Eubacteriales bacterium]|nr:hypothetical protein [Eubacteriales bacterium]
MDQFLAILLVIAVAAAFYGVSLLKVRKMHPLCDKFATAYCELTDRLLDERNISSSLSVEKMDGGLNRLRPIEQQPEAIRAALSKTIDETVIDAMRDLFFLRDSIQSHASNGSFAKDKYNAITNQIFNSLNTYLSIVKDPSLLFSDKDLEQLNYFLQKQKHIRNVTLPSIVSHDCATKIAIE